MEEIHPGWKRWIKQIPLHFCKGCLYGAILNNLAKALEELEKKPSQVVAFSGIGCAGAITDRYFKTDTVYTTHGRPIPFAIGTKLAKPALTVIVVSGDGDLISIGKTHLIEIARRNIQVPVFCANNFIYGMTGGQVGATTPRGAFTSTSPKGSFRQPIDTVKLVLASGCSRASRFSVMPLGNESEPMLEEIKKSIEYPGFSFFELICPCKTHFSRKNKLTTAKEVKEYLRNLLINKEEAKKLSPKDKKNKLLCGTFNSLLEYVQLIEG